VASIFHKIPKEWARFCRGKRNVPSIAFCVKFEEPTIFWASHFHKNVTGEHLCFEKNKNTLSYCCFVKKCEVPKVFLEFLVAVFSIFVDFPNDQCGFNTGALVQMFFQKNVKTPFEDRL
jgi:hypothetical protein